MQTVVYNIHAPFFIRLLDCLQQAEGKYETHSSYRSRTGKSSGTQNFTFPTTDAKVRRPSAARIHGDAAPVPLHAAPTLPEPRPEGTCLHLRIIFLQLLRPLAPRARRLQRLARPRRAGPTGTADASRGRRELWIRRRGNPRRPAGAPSSLPPADPARPLSSLPQAPRDEQIQRAGGQIDEQAAESMPVERPGLPPRRAPPASCPAGELPPLHGLPPPRPSPLSRAAP